MKKKILFMLVFILTIVAIQVVAFADMDAPYINSYTASITEIDGTTYYSFDWSTQEFTEAGKLNYGDKVEIVYEQTIKDEIYGTFYENEEQFGKTYIVKTAAFEVFEEKKVEPQKLDYENKIEAIVLKENGLEIYNGPAYGYSKVDEIIPKGTEITLYNDEEVGMPWFYYENGENSGWVCELDGSIGYEPEYDNYQIVTYKDLKLYKTTENKEVATIVPANTTITDCMSIDAWSQGNYITYEGISGYATYYNYATNCSWVEEDFSYVVNYPAKLYKEGSLRSEVLIEEIPEGTELKYKICSDIRGTGWIYTTYNNISGWVFYIESSEEYQSYLDDELKYSEESDITEIVENEQVENIVNDDEILNEITDTNIDKPSGETKMTISGMQILLICIGLAVVIALTSFVTIQLVNKKNKKEETSTESEKE